MSKIHDSVESNMIYVYKNCVIINGCIKNNDITFLRIMNCDIYMNVFLRKCDLKVNKCVYVYKTL